ncbi:hypothetical protein LguiA_023453 [Lonicera macranthoides]
MGQGASSMVKYLLLCGESSEDHEQNQPLFYSQSSSSRSSTNNNNNNNNNYAFLLPTLSSSSSGSNSFVDSTTSHITLPPHTPSDFYNEHTIKCDALDHITLPPYTPSDFYNEHTIKCDALDHQNLLGSNSVSSSTITVRSLWEYSASFSGTSNGEEEFAYFPRFGDEYSSVTTTESDPLVDQVIEEEERVSKRGVAIKEIRRINHYSSNQRILLVGEGDFSFSRSLARAFGSASNIIATSLDSVGFLQKNYEKAMSNIQSLKARGCIVLHSVDATQMANSVLIKGMKFDRIIYNFPLAGFFPRESRKAQLCRNRALVGGFLKNAKKMISENGEIHVTHKLNGFFREWQLEALALARGLRLVQEVHFNLKDYPGYCTKYGFGGDKNFDCSQSKTYKFGLLY